MHPSLLLFIKLVLFTGFLSIVGWGLYKGYNAICPDGFNACFGLEDGPGSPVVGPSGSERVITTPPASRSINYSKCTRFFNEDDKTKTCYNPNAGTGGVGWFWSNTKDGVECKNLVTNYKIDVSSAESSHNVIRSHVLNKKNANGIIFNNARSWTIGPDGTKYNMLINVTPYDKDGKVLADPLMGEELNPLATGTDCGAIGVTPIDFFDSFKLPEAESKEPAPPPPVNCEGSYQPSTACVAGPYCGDMGLVTQKFVATKQPQHGGTSCPTNEKSVQCTRNQPCTEHPNPPAERPSCQYGAWQDETVASYLNVSELFPDKDPKDGTSKGGTDDRVCSKQWRDGENDLPGIRKQYRPITNVNFSRGQQTVGCVPQTNDTENTDDPLATERRFDCNENYYKPVNCTGAWTTGRTAHRDFREMLPGPGGSWADKRETTVYESWAAKKGFEFGKHGGDNSCPAHATERVKSRTVSNR